LALSKPVKMHYLKAPKFVGVLYKDLYGLNLHPRINCSFYRLLINWKREYCIYSITLL
jgi:hypothetical protein